MADPDFFPSQAVLTAADILELQAVQSIDGVLNVPIINAAELDDAQAPLGSIGFIKDKKYQSSLQQNALCAVIVPADMREDVPVGCCAIISSHPRLSFAAVLAKLYPFVFDTVPKGDRSDLIHPTAVIAKDVRMGHGVVIGAHVRIGQGTQIGDYSVIGDHVQIGTCSRIGRHNTIRYARIGDGFWCDDHNAIGCAGFAFEPSPEGFKPIAQVGLLRIGDGVHFTSGNSIDRGALGDTVIEDNVQIESLCKIGHNVHIGACTAIVGHCAIAGSAKIGQRVQIAGKVGVKGFIEIGDGATIMANSAVTNSVEAGAMMFGVPAHKYKEYGARELAISKLVKQARARKATMDK